MLMVKKFSIIIYANPEIIKESWGNNKETTHFLHPTPLLISTIICYYLSELLCKQNNQMNLNKQKDKNDTT